MYVRVLLAILVVAIPLNGSYLTIQETVLETNEIHVVFENLIDGEWYRFNWTDNKDGYFFQFNPDSNNQQSKPLTLKNTYGRAYFVFELWYDQGNELLAQTTRFWSDDASTGNGGFKIPFLGDILDFVFSLPPEAFILMVVSLLGLIIFNFMFRRGR